MQTVVINIADLQGIIQRIEAQRRELDLLRQEVTALLPFVEADVEVVLINPLTDKKFEVGL